MPGSAVCRRLLAFAVLVTSSACSSVPTEPVTTFPDELGSGGAPVAQAADAGDILLLNGSLEANTAWYFSAPVGMSAGYVSSGGVNNSRAVQFTGNGTSAEGQFAMMGQAIPVGDLSGRKVTLTATIRLVDVEGPGVSIALRGDDPSQPGNPARIFSTTQGRLSISGSKDWATYTVDLDGFDRGIRTVYAFVVLLPGTTGTVYVDDLSLGTGSAELPPIELTNGNFETGDDAPDHWWRGGPGAANFNFNWTSDDAYTGSRAVSISRAAPSAQDFAFWAQTLRPDAFVGGAITLRVRVKTDLTGTGVSLVIRGDNTPRPFGVANAFVTTQGSRPITGTSDWVEQTVTLNNLPDGIQSLTVYLVYLPGTTGTVHFDAVELIAQRR